MKRKRFEDLPVGACFAFDTRASRATRRKVTSHSSVVIPNGKRPLRVDDIEVAVVTHSCPVGNSFFGKAGKKTRVRCEVFATAKRNARKLEYAGSFASCRAAEDYADWLKANGLKSRVKRKGFKK